MTTKNLKTAITAFAVSLLGLFAPPALAENDPFILVENGDLAALQQLEDEGGLYMGVRDHRGRNLLLIAARYDHLHIVKWILPRLEPVQVDNYDAYDGRRPLFWAVRNGNYAMVDAFVEKGVLLYDGEPLPYDFAIERGHYEMADYLLGKNPQFAGIPTDGYEDSKFVPNILQYAHNAGIVISAKRLANELDAVLFEAAEAGNLALVEAAHKDGANCQSESGGKTPVTIAHENEFFGVRDYLLDTKECGFPDCGAEFEWYEENRECIPSITEGDCTTAEYYDGVRCLACPEGEVQADDLHSCINCNSFGEQSVDGECVPCADDEVLNGNNCLHISSVCEVFGLSYYEEGNACTKCESSVRPYDNSSLGEEGWYAVQNSDGTCEYEYRGYLPKTE